MTFDTKNLCFHSQTKQWSLIATQSVTQVTGSVLCMLRVFLTVPGDQQEVG